jgi:hypothetical protein
MTGSIVGMILSNPWAMPALLAHPKNKMDIEQNVMKNPKILSRFFTGFTSHWLTKCRSYS